MARPALSIDDSLAEIGELGATQWKYVLALSVIHVYYPLHMIGYNFLARNVDYEVTCPGNAASNQSGLVTADPCFKLDDGCQMAVLGSETSLVTEWDLTCDR